jgi:Secretion system C-terminal sorting domain
VFDQQINAAALTADSGCIAVGQNITGAFASTYIMACRIAANGDSLWMKAFPGTGADNAFDVAVTSDDGCIIAGSYGTNNNDAYLVRLDSSGNVLWTKQYGTATGIEKAYCALQTADAGFLAGIVSPTGSVLYKLNPSGDTVWTKPLPLGPWDIRPVSGGRYIIAGVVGLDAALTLVDSLGNPIWTRTYGGSQSEVARAAQQTSDGGFIFAGVTNSFGAGGADFYVAKTDSQGLTTDVRGNDGTIPVGVHLEQNYPNPFNPTTSIKYSIPVGTYGRTSLRVYDLLGREVAVLVNERKAPGSYTVQFNGSGLASGVYFYRLTAGDFVATKKLLMLR